MIKISFLKKNDKKTGSLKSSGFSDAFISACQNMDIVALSDLFNDDAIINDQTKWEFLSTVRDTFTDFRSNGNETLNFEFRKCCFCTKSRGKQVYFFSGKGAYDFIAFYFDKTETDLKNITICNEPSGTIRSAVYEKMFNIH